MKVEYFDKQDIIKVFTTRIHVQKCTSSIDISYQIMNYC